MTSTPGAVSRGQQRERVDRVHDRRVERDDVAVGEGEHGVEVHRGAQLGHAGDDHPRSAAPCVEQRRGDLGDRLPRGALAHADQHDAVADRHDVAALEGGLAPVLLGVAPPDRRADEVGVELVDRLVDQGLVLAGRPVERVHRQAAVQPAGGVAGVERVRQRRHQVLAGAGRLAGERDVAGCGSRRAGRWWPGRRSGTPRAARRRATRGRRGCRRRARARPGWARSCGRAASRARPGPAIVSASSSCSSTTSTPRWVSLLTKSAWSRWAFSTHITSSNSSSSLLLGVSRRCARPGAQTSTLRSLPTSEWTPYVEETLVGLGHCRSASSLSRIRG